MKNLFNLSSLSIEEITAILDRAQQFADGVKSDRAKGKVVASLFFEPSTRTQNSYSTAVMRLGRQGLTFNSSVSSMTKGETFYDTVKVFESLAATPQLSEIRKTSIGKNLKVLRCRFCPAATAPATTPPSPFWTCLQSGRNSAILTD